MESDRTILGPEFLRLADGRSVVQKRFRTLRDLECELELRESSGLPWAELISISREPPSLIMERVIPGTNLRELSENGADSRATEIFSQIIMGLTPTEITMSKREDVFGSIRASLSLLRELGLSKWEMDRILKLLTGLELLGRRFYLLHGDLHHENILKKQNAWVLIDPKPQQGPLGLEISVFLRNPSPRLASENFDSRTKFLSEALGLEQNELMGWGVIGCALSLAWDWEDQLPQREGQMDLLREWLGKISG